MLPKITPELTIEPLYLEYINALRQLHFTGDIHTDYASRLAVATDNSIHQVIPQAVLKPRSTEDISIALTLTQQKNFHAIRFAPRGGGTGTNGQSLSAGIIIDCSMHLNRILELNLQEMWVRIQPGVVLDQLNHYLKEFGVHFAPEISPSNRATLGGMINTDACGMGSKQLGRTSDHALGLTCVLADGSILQTDHPTQKTLCDTVSRLLMDNQNFIAEKFVKAPRTLNGYNLAKALQHNQLNLTYLLCGSEGTLGVMSECKLKLSPLPKLTKLIVIKYRQFDDALYAREITNDIHPLVIETIDEKLIELAQQDSLYLKIKGFIEGANAINLVQFVSDDEADMDKQLSLLCKQIDQSQYASGYYLAKNADEIKLLWELRKQSIGLISKCQDGTRRPIPFIEDTAVPPENLPAYITELKALLDNHQLVYGMYGHIDAGCIHVRPALDTALDEALIQELSHSVVALVKKYHGVIWGEHGKGYRSEFGPEFFGDALYDVLRKIKRLFDPYNQLNPGKIATPFQSNEHVVKITDSLRSRYDKQIDNKIQTEYASALACNGNGACFNYSTSDTMCPSFKVTQDRIHSPKGRATVLREWLRLVTQARYDMTSSFNFFHRWWNGKTQKSDFSTEVYNAFAGCLGCKACLNQCPLNVNIPQLKSKFLAHYHSRYLHSLRDVLIANIERIARLQAMFPRVTNRLLQNKIVKFILLKLAKLIDVPVIDLTDAKVIIQPPRRCEERFLRRSNPVLGLKITDKVKDWIASSRKALLATTVATTVATTERLRDDEVGCQQALVLIQDAFTSFYENRILQAYYQFFTALGFNVKIQPFFLNGKPWHVNGFINRFNQIAKKNIVMLREYADKNIPMVGIDPSMTLVYRDEYQSVLDNEPLNFSVQLAQEFLLNHLDKLPKSHAKEKYYLLSHCSEKSSLPESEKHWQMIFAACGLDLVPLRAGCCGMAGAFGYEAEHKSQSVALYDMDWKQHVASVGINLLVTGASCRSQIKRMTDNSPRHPIEILTRLIQLTKKIAIN